MAKKMYYTEEEAATLLGVEVAALTTLVRDQKLRVFKDGPRNMYRTDEVDALVSQGGAAVAEPPAPPASEGEIELAPADSSGTGSISLADSAVAPSTPAGKEDTVITAEGSSIFSEEEIGAEGADPLAKTQVTMSMEDQIAADGSGSGSGLLDLTRESDDTSLGEVLDKIEMEGSAAPAAPEAPAAPAVEAAMPLVVEIPDPLAGLFNGLIIGCAAAALVLGAVSIAAMCRAVPSFLEFFADYKTVILLAFAVVIGVAGVVGHLLIKPASAKGAGG
ncbi:MAG: helix-turn-helix domain-containing protein [Phycisphaerae bacterium]|jgi:hypothetical protein